MPNLTKDLTFRVDRVGNVIMASESEHVMNVIQFLLNSIPGMDDYNNDMGINLNSIRVRPHNTNGSRDTKLELEIGEQISKYTDLTPINVVVTFPGNVMKIYLEVQYLNNIYSVDIEETSENTLRAQLRNRQ